MKPLQERELQWLEALAKNHEFFASFLLHYNLKNYLENNQYYWLRLYINQAEENGDALLSTEETTFLRENSENHDQLRELFEIYNIKGYLERQSYEEFLLLKSQISGETVESAPKVRISSHNIIKVPCPHCNFLCSRQTAYCSKCGEPLPKLERIKSKLDASDISNVDYAERHIILALEKLIGKSIPLTEKFAVSSTCYVKEEGFITGLSLFNCGLAHFPREILRIRSLKHLALRRNNLKELPKTIGFLSSLEWLDLRINKLETLPKAIGLLYRLKNLNVSSNNLMEIPNSIGDLLLLKTLNLKNNKLKKIPESIENLKYLEVLNLKANYRINLPEGLEKLSKEGLQLLL
jgi:hypothetical protein